MSITQQYKSEECPASRLAEYSVSTIRAPWFLAEMTVMANLTNPAPTLCGLTMWPIRKGAWLDAEWLVVATFKRLPN